MSDTNIKFFKVQTLPTSGYVVGGVYFCKADKKAYIRTSTGWEDYAGIVDAALSSTSTNPVQNAVVNSALSGKANVSHTHTKAEVGLGNVDNTADANKSVKYATSAGSATTATTATKADKLTTPRTIGLGTAVTSTPTSFSGESNITIPVSSVKEAYLTWGGKNWAGSYGPIDAAMISELGANRFAFGKPEGITIEYSRDSGSTWIDYGATDTEKQNLFSGIVQSFGIGKHDSTNKATAAYMLRITIDTSLFGIYTTLNKFMILCSTNGSSGCYCTIQKALQSDPTNYVTVTNQEGISGWSGYNIINISGVTTYGNKPTSQYGRLRFIFGCTGVQDANYNGLIVHKINGFGGVGWATPSTLAKTGHLYSIGSGQSAAFPANVNAPTLSESGTSLANKYAAKSHTHTKSQITDFPTSLKNPNAITIKGNGTELASYDGSAAKTVNIAGSGAVTVSADASAGSIVVSSTDSKVTSVDNHYAPTGTTTKSASGGTVTDITNSSSGTNVVTGVTMDAKGHVTGVTSLALKSTNKQTITGVKGSAESSFRTGNVNLTPANLGITVVNNTADANKNVASAGKLTTDAGSATKPVYFSNGIPVSCSHSVEKDVPSNAIFTDTHYTSKTIIANSATATSELDATIENPYLNHIENGVVRSSIRIFGATRYSSDLSLPDGIYINPPSAVTTIANGLMLAEDKVKLDCFMAIDLYDLDLGVGDATSDTEVLSRMDGIMKNAREKQNGILLVYDASGGTTNVAKYPAAVLVSSYYSDTYYQMTIAIFKGTKVQTVGFFRNDTNITCTANNVFDLSRLSGTTTLSSSSSYLMTSAGVWNAVNTPSTTSSSSTSSSVTLTTTSNHRIMDIATTGTQTYTLPSNPVNNETFVFYKIWSNSSLVIKSSTANMYNVKTASSSKTSSISFTASSSPSRCKVTCVYCSNAWYVMPENLND